MKVEPGAFFFGRKSLDDGVMTFDLRTRAGLGEGVVFPVMHAMIAEWAPPLERSRMTTTIYSGATLGSVVSMSLTGVICQHLGWEPAFYIFGGLGCVWFAFWWFYVYDSPARCVCCGSQFISSYIFKYIIYRIYMCIQMSNGNYGSWVKMRLGLNISALKVTRCLISSHPFITEAEKDLIEVSLGKKSVFSGSISPQPTPPPSPPGPEGAEQQQPQQNGPDLTSRRGTARKNAPPTIPWRCFLTSVPLLALTLTHMCQAFGFYILLTELPSYLKNVLHIGLEQVGRFALVSGCPRAHLLGKFFP